MPIEALEATDEDMPRLFSIYSRAFYGVEPIVDAIYPNHWTPAGAKVGIARFRKAAKTDPCAVYLKAVDTSIPASTPDHPEIVGFSKWLIYTGTPPEDKPFPAQGSEDDYWTSVTDQADLYEYAKAVMPALLAKRNDAIARNNARIVSLDICCVDPKHQRKGAGQAMVAWGMAKADEAGVEAVVESSAAGRPLYEKFGYLFQENVALDPEAWRGKIEPPVFAWLTRPAKAQRVDVS